MDMENGVFSVNTRDLREGKDDSNGSQCHTGADRAGGQRN